jgi:hypothetical protein
MSLKLFTIGTLMAICTFVAQAAAQKNELTGMIGRTFVSDQGIQGAPAYDPNVHFGKGLTYEINYARHFLDAPFWSVAVELPFVADPDEKVHSAQDLTPNQYSSYFLTPAARFNLFPEQAVSPWVSFGGGFGHFNSSSTTEFGAPNPSKGGTTVGVIQAGIGLDVRIAGNFSLRGEARDFYSGVPNLNVITSKGRQNNYFVGGGVVWHF